MNPFDERNNPITIHPSDDDNSQSLFFKTPPGGMLLEESASKVERFIDKASGTLRRILVFLSLIAGILAALALFRPYLHFLDELERWTYTAIDFIFY